MPNSSRYFIFVLSLFIFAFFPLPSHSAPIDPPCTPDNTTADQTCTFCPADGAEYVHLKWDVQGAGDKPTCTLRCIQGDCGYKKLISRKDNQNHPISIGGDLLKPKDDIDLYPTPGLLGGSDLKAGDVYQVSCTYDTGRKDERGRAIRETKYSPKMTIEGCGVSCEVPWSDTKEKLNVISSGDLAYITEKSLPDWVNDITDIDKASLLGSGNQQDIEKFIIEKQNRNVPKVGIAKDLVCSRKSVYFNSKIFYGGNILAEIWTQPLAKMVNDKGYPISITIRQLDWPVYSYASYPGYSGPGFFNGSTHQVIVLSLSGELVAGKEISFDILDPNFPSKVTKLSNCRAAMFYIKYDGKEDWFFDGLGCQSEYGEVFIFTNERDSFMEPDYQFLIAYDQWKQSTCSNESKNTEFCNRGKFTDWLKNNLTDFSNPSAGGGNCYSWTQFMLKVAYRGNFVGKDYHPGDKIGTACNADLTPKSSKSTFGGFTDQLALLKNIVFPINLLNWFK